MYSHTYSKQMAYSEQMAYSSPYILTLCEPAGRGKAHRHAIQ